MAKNGVFAHTDALTEIWFVDAPVASGTPLIRGTKAGVALTDSEGRTGSATVGPYTISGFGTAGVGLDKVTTGGTGDLAVSVATDGTWEFKNVTGVTTATEQGTAIYITSAGALTTTSTDNTLFGYVNYPGTYVKAAGKAPVKIGG